MKQIIIHHNAPAEVGISSAVGANEASEEDAGPTPIYYFRR